MSSPPRHCCSRLVRFRRRAQHPRRYPAGCELVVAGAQGPRSRRVRALSRQHTEETPVAVTAFQSGRVTPIPCSHCLQQHITPPPPTPRHPSPLHFRSQGYLDSALAVAPSHSAYLLGARVPNFRALGAPAHIFCSFRGSTISFLDFQLPRCHVHRLCSLPRLPSLLYRASVGQSP